MQFREKPSEWIPVTRFVQDDSFTEEFFGDASYYNLEGEPSVGVNGRKVRGLPSGPKAKRQWAGRRGR